MASAAGDDDDIPQRIEHKESKEGPLPSDVKEVKDEVPPEFDDTDDEDESALSIYERKYISKSGSFSVCR